jgi:predicted TIM-barrel fold metal-dependent hydrolase/GNAT superfamily N-acetyltransferase
MKIIDAHVHMGLNKFCINEKTDFKVNLNNSYIEFINLMDENSIDKAIILPIPHKDFDSYLSNDYLISAYNTFPERFIPFCRIDDRLEENFKRGFRGSKIHCLYEETNIKQIKNSLLFLESIGAPVIIHALFSNKVEQMKEILKIAPNLKVVLAHMGRGHIYTDEGVAENAMALKKYDNVFFETSTVGNALTIKTVCGIIGDDRVIFGSDYPFGKAWFENIKAYTYHDEVAFFDNVGMGTGSIEKILYLNTYNMLNLSDKTIITVRKIKKSDYEQIIELFANLSECDTKFLALEPKLSLIKQNIKLERHCYVAVSEDIIIGFMRESGRPGGYSLLEELVVHPERRKKGIAWKMLKYYNRIYPKTFAKTNVKNDDIIRLLKGNGYCADNPDAQRIINWTRYEE